MVGYEASISTLNMSIHIHVSRDNMAACDFDEVFDQMQGEPQRPEANQNELPLNRQLANTDQMRVTWDETFDLSNGLADFSSSTGYIRTPGVIEDIRVSVKTCDDL